MIQGFEGYYYDRRAFSFVDSESVQGLPLCLQLFKKEPAICFDYVRGCLGRTSPYCICCAVDVPWYLATD